jgi:succinate dehydrogenase/fumarate reductase flavoprotein subunit
VNSERKLREETIETDVLIIGAGAGGLMAAITAAEFGLQVTLCEKGNGRRSGGIMGGNDHFLCYIPEIHGPKVRDKLITESLTRIPTDEDLVSKRLDLTYDVLKKWESWGVNMKKDGHYEFVGHWFTGLSEKTGEPRAGQTMLHFSDNELCAKLAFHASSMGVRIINRVMITDLLQNKDGRVVGAIGISTRDQILYIFQSKSTVINAGSVNRHRLYPHPDLIGYSMAQLATGDGQMIAYRAGAELQNLEFVRRQVSLRFGPDAGKGTWIGVARDNEGKPIAPPYLTKPNAETGDPAIENAEAVDYIRTAGKGPVWMDPRGISEEDEQYMRWGFKSEALSHFLVWLDEEKIDVKKTRFEFVAMQHQTNCQIRIDGSFKTKLEGLFAIPLGLLSMSATGGVIVGESAAKDAKDTCLALTHHPDLALQRKTLCETLLNREGTQYADWREAQWAIWQVMHGYALPPHRTEGTLLAGCRQLRRIRECAQRILKAANQHELYHCIEVLNLMDMAELVLLATNERKESRGMTRRQDYPFTNPMLNRFLVASQEKGEPTFRWESPRRTKR